MHESVLILGKRHRGKSEAAHQFCEGHNLHDQPTREVRKRIRTTDRIVYVSHSLILVPKLLRRRFGFILLFDSTPSTLKHVQNEYGVDVHLLPRMIRSDFVILKRIDDGLGNMLEDACDTGNSLGTAVESYRLDKLISVGTKNIVRNFRLYDALRSKDHQTHILSFLLLIDMTTINSIPYDLMVVLEHFSFHFDCSGFDKIIFSIMFKFSLFCHLNL